MLYSNSSENIAAKINPERLNLFPLMKSTSNMNINVADGTPQGNYIILLRANSSMPGQLTSDPLNSSPSLASVLISRKSPEVNVIVLKEFSIEQKILIILESFFKDLMSVLTFISTIIGIFAVSLYTIWQHRKNKQK